MQIYVHNDIGLIKLRSGTISVHYAEAHKKSPNLTSKSFLLAEIEKKVLFYNLNLKRLLLQV